MQTHAASPFLAALLAKDITAPHGLEWYSRLRSEALERANALSVPSLRDEDWRFTDLSALYKQTFAHCQASNLQGEAQVQAYVVPEAPVRLTLVDGRYAPDLSVLNPGAGVTVMPLTQALNEHEPLVRKHLGQIATYADHPFRALNTAWLSEGAFIHVAHNAVAPHPIHLLFLSTQAQTVSHPRALIVSESGSEVTIIEEHTGPDNVVYWSNAVTEIVVGANARVRHVKLQEESKTAFHLASCVVQVAQDGQYESNAISVGARISRNDVAVHQLGTGVTAHLDGLALISGRQIADTHSFIDHAHPHGVSRQLHKCVVAGGAHAVFNGRVLVREGAQQTDSAQQSRNLLLSDKARVDTKPQLEIFADDVKCSHGATVGQMESEEVFYLRSRGLSETAAVNLLTYGFAAEIVDRIGVKSVVAKLRRIVMSQTGAGELA